MSDKPPARVQKVAVLGGGAAAMAAVFHLTSAPDWKSHYEVTVYQVGWRLGGKGASGRNSHVANRIEEHGFHIWWGFYDNAFRMIQDCYAELRRPLGTPLATWNEAFKPIDFDIEYMHVGHSWTPHMSSRPMNEGLPGQDIDKPLPARADYLHLLLQGLADGLTSSSGSAPRPSGAARFVTGIFALWLKLAAFLAWLPHKNTSSRLSRARYAVIDAMLRVFILVLWLLERKKIQAGNQVNGAPTSWNVDDPRELAALNAYAGFVSVDMACAMMRGMIRDDLLTRGFDAANEMDFRDWLHAHGAREVTLQSFITRGLYDMVFASQDRSSSLEAGTMVRILMRSYFTYKGAYLWRMMAGMGDVVFAPLYDVLHARGVKFAFFHRVEKLHLSEDGTSIAGISIARQATLKPGATYDPLVPVNGLRCWPSEPRYDLLVEGEQLKEKIKVAGMCVPRYNLESFWTAWQNPEQLHLKAGDEFDVVVLGISVGALRWICAELLEQPGERGEKWRRMIRHVTTTSTQAFQLWLKADIAGLGWPLWKYPLPIMDAYDRNQQTVDSWADMSHLIMRETWPPDNLPANISYFAGAFPDCPIEELPGPHAHDFPIKQLEQGKANTLQFLRDQIKPIWPRATAPDGTHRDALSWQLLVDQHGHTGEERLNSQYVRVNIDPSERYVLFPPGSTKHRLHADGSGYANLFLAGDWIYNGGNAGYVESAVMGGMLAAQAVTRRLLGRAWPERIVGWPSD